MQCYKCATPIPENSRFCSACGVDVSGDTQGPTLIAEAEPDLQARLQTELGTEYILERELGRGGMAVVFLGHDALLNRKVAVKVLPPELTYGGGGSMIERFKREAQTAAKLDHPNIIPVHRVSPGGKLFWYVMKYLDGEALDDILDREGQLAVERTVDIVGQVAAALDYAHQNQVVHRDVKPANVLVDKRGWCTVTDFGIAKALDANALTASGSIIGTPYYMSPEQCKGKKVGPAADQYSLAVMAYQMLGGHVPFTGDSAVEIVHKHVADPVPPLGVLRPELPPMTIQVIERALAKTAEERFVTVAEFARALKAAAEGVDITVAPPKKTGGPRMSKTALVSPVPGALRTAKGTWRKRKGLLIGGAGTVVVAVAVGLLLKGGATSVQPAADTTVINRDFASGPSVPTPAAAVTPPAESPPAAASPDTAKRDTRAPTRTTPSASRRQPAGRPPARQQAQPSAQPAAAQPAPAPAAPPVAATGFVTVASSPASATIIINGQTQQRNPVRDFVVPAGTVTIRFLATDTMTGATWSQEIVCVVPPGEHKNCGRIPLRRP